MAQDTLQSLEAQFPDSEQTMPAVFVGHGSPMNAIEDNPYSRAWGELGRMLPRPRAILCISAHWVTRGPQVTAMERPETIHDFGGFPQELFAMQYPAPGSPALAELTRQALAKEPVRLATDWGLDHGTWSVLARMYPVADVPVVQLSLDGTRPPEWHYALGGQLRALRRKGILIVGSGNVVHNLRLISWDDQAFDWAKEFDQTVERLILAHDHQPLIHYETLGRSARLAVPTNEHYLPLLYILALQGAQETLRFYCKGVTMGSLAMRCVQIG
jgi:4,5-DOPA dioxygenase extradiol